MFSWLVGSSEQPPVWLQLRSSKTFIIITVATAIFTDIFAYGIVVPVLPFALTERTDVQEHDVQRWISIFLAVYGAALLAAAPVCGWLADRTSSRRLPLLVGLVALGGSTVLLCLGSSVAMLLAGRVLQGVSAAVVWVVGLALLVDTVGGDDVGQAMGYVGLSMSLALLLAPMLGGVVFAAAGYYAVFAMAFGLIALDIILRLVMVEKKIARQWLPEGENVDGSNPKTEHDGGTTSHQGALGEADVEKTSSTSHPQVMAASAPDRGNGDATPPSWTDKLPRIFMLLTSRRLLSALWASMIQSVVMTAFDSILPLYVRGTFGWDSLGAGLIFLPIVAASFAGPIIGHISDRWGPRWFATFGFTLACPAVILLRLVDHNNIKQKILLCALLTIVGLGLTCSLTPLMAEITYAVDATAKRRPAGYFGKHGVYAQAYSLFNVAWAAGAMIGPLLGGLINDRYGWKVTTLVLGCVCAFTAIPTGIWTGGSIFKLRRMKKEAACNESPG